MNSRIYDVIIIASGPAGLACAISLSQNGYSCLLIEKNIRLQGKVCGDALTTSALVLLEHIGIDIATVEGKKVYSKKEYKNGVCRERTFFELFGREFEYGVSHDDMLNCMLNNALKNGVEIVYNHECNRILRQPDCYCIDNLYFSKEVVLANGAHGLSLIGETIPNDLPVGMSARIHGKCNYSDIAFHFFYDDCYEGGYAWLFPIGNELWNIGVYGCSGKNLKQLYYKFERTIFDNSDNYVYLRKPKGAVVGATKAATKSEYMYLLAGDCAFSANYETGEGISFAIRDGINVANTILCNDIDILLNREYGVASYTSTRK